MYWEEPTKNGHSVWRFKLLGAPPAINRVPSIGISLPPFSEHGSHRVPPTDMNVDNSNVYDVEKFSRLEREREMRENRDREREQRDRDREREREREQERERERENMKRDRERQEKRDQFEINGHAPPHRTSSGVAIFLPPPIPIHSHSHHPTLDPSPLHPLSHTLPPPFPLPHPHSGLGSRSYLPSSSGLDPFLSFSSPPPRGPLPQIPPLHSRTQFPPPPPPHHSSFTQFPPPPYGLNPHPPPRLSSFTQSPPPNIARIWDHDIPPKQP